MNKAVESAFDYEDNEEGAAKSAASLGPDGGPLVATDVSYDAGEEALEDDSWLDEELSDEELAALSEEDFDDLEDLEGLDDLDDLNEEDALAG